MRGGRRGLLPLGGGPGRTAPRGQPPPPGYALLYRGAALLVGFLAFLGGAILLGGVRCWGGGLEGPGLGCGPDFWTYLSFVALALFSLFLAVEATHSRGQGLTWALLGGSLGLSFAGPIAVGTLTVGAQSPSHPTPEVHEDLVLLLGAAVIFWGAYAVFLVRGVLSARKYWEARWEDLGVKPP